MGREQIDNSLHEIGFIMLNRHKLLPSIVEADGEWDDLIRLIETREVFICKLIENKSTILSRALYFSLKKSKTRLDLSRDEKDLIEFITKNEPVSTDLIRRSIAKDKKEIDKLISSLQNKLLITVVAEGKRLTNSWGTYRWGTSILWEEGMADRRCCTFHEDLDAWIDKMRSHQINEKYIKQLIRK